MKKILILAVAAMAIVACKKETGTTPNDQIANTVEVRIKTGSTYAAGAAEDGVGKENAITDGWVAFAKNKDGDNYTAAVATGTGADSRATFIGIPVNSTVYVFANSVHLVNATGQPATMPTGTAVTKAQIEALIEAVDKTELGDKNTALQASLTAPEVASIPMSGTGIVPATPFDPTVGQEDKVKLTIGLERELSKVQLTVSKTPKADGKLALATGTIDGIDNVAVRRIVKRVSPFVTFHSTNTGNAGAVENAEWFIKKTPYIKDDRTESAENITNRSDYGFEYAMVDGADAVTQNFYVTPNYAQLPAYATAVIIEARISGTVDGVVYTNTPRFYRAYVYDADLTAEKGITLKNAIYKINATISGVGSPTEEEALDKDNVDLNVYVEVKKWAVRAFDVDME